MNKKEIWIQDTLESLKEVKTPKVSSSLDEKILRRLLQDDIKVIAIRPQLTWAVAASLVLLIGINCLMLIQHYKRQTKETQSDAYTLYSNYFSYTEQL